jgi:hypothetical protein
MEPCRSNETVWRTRVVAGDGARLAVHARAELHQLAHGQRHDARLPLHLGGVRVAQGAQPHQLPLGRRRAALRRLGDDDGADAALRQLMSLSFWVLVLVVVVAAEEKVEVEEVGICAASGLGNSRPLPPPPPLITIFPRNRQLLL